MTMKLPEITLDEQFPVITLDVARDLLKRAVATQGPDFVYNPAGEGRCYYTPQPNSALPIKQATGCLVGTAVELHGVPRELLSVEGGVMTLANALKGVVTFTESALTYLSTAQYAQDRGSAWGNAHQRAEDWAMQQGVYVL